MNPPIRQRRRQRVHIEPPVAVARWLDIGNAMYTTSLRCLLQGFGARPIAQAKATWLAGSFALDARSLCRSGQGLAARPATDDVPDGPNAQG